MAARNEPISSTNWRSQWAGSIMNGAKRRVVEINTKKAEAKN
jgi:hypothetical protein